MTDRSSSPSATSEASNVPPPRSYTSKPLSLSANFAVIVVAAGKLYSGRGGFVQQSKYFEARRPRRLLRQKALVAVGVCRHAEHDLEFVELARAQIGSLPESRVQRRHHFGDHLRHIELLAGNIDGGVGTGVLEQTLERTEDSPAWFALLFQGVPSVNSLLPGNSQQRGNQSFACPSEDSKFTRG